MERPEMKQLFLALTTALLIGCGSTKTATVGAPSSAGVRDQIHAASSSARSAADSVRSTGESNRKISSALDAIDRKLIILDRWNETHRPRN